ncbi:MAG: cytochrome b N-terminal domain-containing protein [Caldimicrobium sp.]
MKFPKGFIFLPLAWISVSSFILSLFSGLILSFHYFYTEPLISVLKIENFVFMGKYWRELHYISSQIALIALFLHLIDSVYKKFYFLKSKLTWLLLIFSLFLLLFITFTGYVIRQDETGELAGAIAENILLSVPYIGRFLNKIFLSISEVGVGRVYNWHIFLSFGLALGLLFGHFKIKAVFRWSNFPYFLIISLLPLILDFPLRAYQGLKARGPWFFIGVQEMLKFLPPVLVFFWLLLPFFLIFLYVIIPKKERLLHFFLISYLMLYTLFSFLFLFKH